MTTHNIYKKTPKPPAGFETATSVGKRLQTYALDRVATGNGHFALVYYTYVTLTSTLNPFHSLRD